MADGTVYVFNQTSSAISAFAPNGFTAGPIARWSGPETEAPYTPAQLAVRLLAKDSANKPGNFAYGKNKVLFKTNVDWHFEITFKEPKIEESGKKSTKKNEDVDPIEPLEPAPQTLLLYVTTEGWTLYGTNGGVQQTGKVHSVSSAQEAA